MKLFLALAVLSYMSILDIRSRRINDFSWLALLAIGLTAFVFDITSNTSEATARLFALSLGTGLLLAAPFFIVGRMTVGDEVAILGAGDGKALVALSTVTYDLSPFPFIGYVLMVAMFLAVFWGFLQEGRDVRVDVPLVVPITLGFLVMVAHNTYIVS